MRRRPSPEGAANTPPRRLLTYSAADWPNADCHPECAYWDALRAFMDAHPEADWPLDHRGPDQPWHPEWI